MESGSKIIPEYAPALTAGASEHVDGEDPEHELVPAEFGGSSWASLRPRRGVGGRRRCVAVVVSGHDVVTVAGGGGEHAEIRDDVCPRLRDERGEPGETGRRPVEQAVGRPRSGRRA